MWAPEKMGALRRNGTWWATDGGRAARLPLYRRLLTLYNGGIVGRERDIGKESQAMLQKIEHDRLTTIDSGSMVHVMLTGMQMRRFCNGMDGFRYQEVKEDG